MLTVKPGLFGEYAETIHYYFDTQEERDRVLAALPQMEKEGVLRFRAKTRNGPLQNHEIRANMVTISS